MTRVVMAGVAVVVLAGCGVDILGCETWACSIQSDYKLTWTRAGGCGGSGVSEGGANVRQTHESMTFSSSSYPHLQGTLRATDVPNQYAFALSEHTGLADTVMTGRATVSGNVVFQYVEEVKLTGEVTTVPLDGGCEVHESFRGGLAGY